MGTLFKKKGSKQWQMGVRVEGRQLCRSAHTTNKQIAKKLLARWKTEVFEGRFHLPQSNPPYFEEWANEFLTKVVHPNTRKRYTSSVGKLKGKFQLLAFCETHHPSQHSQVVIDCGWFHPFGDPVFLVFFDSICRDARKSQPSRLLAIHSCR